MEKKDIIYLCIQWVLLFALIISLAMCQHYKYKTAIPENNTTTIVHTDTIHHYDTVTITKP